jgi:uncharacterized protein YkwD
MLQRLDYNGQGLNTHMNIMELFDPAPKGYYDERQDQTVAKMSDSRRTRLTLQHLNQLRQSHDVRKLEHEKKLEKIAKQYTPAPEGGGLGGGPGLGL